MSGEPIKSEDLTAAADILSSGLQNVAKSDDKTPPPFVKKDDDKDEKEKDEKDEGEEKAEKSLTLTESELEGLIGRAATAGAQAALSGVQKSLEQIGSDVQASMRFQKVSVDVLGQIGDLVTKVDAVQKAMAQEVTAIGESAAPRKTVAVEEVAKAAPEAKAPVQIDLDKLREVTKSMEMDERINAIEQAKKGDYRFLSATQKAALGLNEGV